MGLFSNPLGYAGYPPGVTGTPTTQNSTVRAATASEVTAGTLNNAYVSPSTVSSLDAGLFASPPVLGSTTPNQVKATSLSATGNVTLATGASVTSNSFANVAPSSARTTTFFGGNDAVNDTWNIFGGANTLGTQSMNVFGGVNSGGTQSVSYFGGNSSGGTQSFSVLTGTRAGTFTVGTGAAHVINMGGASALIGFFGKTAAVQQTQGAITNNVTSGGTTGTIADFTDLTVYANDSAAIRNDIYQLALGLQGCIAALRTYGLLA